MFINKKAYPLQMKVLCILAISFCLSACISRLSRPEISGHVVDELGQPIANVRLAETQTDQNGYFLLKEQRYSVFLLKEMMQMEAPPVSFQVTLNKLGYQTCYLQYFNRFGGGQAKGARWEVGQVILISDLVAKN